MNHIDGLFSKIKSAFASAERNKSDVSQACEVCCGMKIDPAQIEINGQYLRLNVSPAAKSIIFQKKGKILESLKDKIKPQILDIR